MKSGSFSHRGRARSVLAWATLALCVSANAPGSGQSAVQGPPPTYPANRPAAPAVPPPPATGLLVGQVVDAAGGSVAGAIVTISGTIAPPLIAAGVSAPPASAFVPRRMLTNADGRFLFTELPKATYTIDVTKSGYVPSGPGKLRPDGPTQPLELAEGERNGALKITLWKYAAISGVLTDDSGEPFVGATIWSLRRSYSTGLR